MIVDIYAMVLVFTILVSGLWTMYRFESEKGCLLPALLLFESFLAAYALGVCQHPESILAVIWETVLTLGGVNGAIFLISYVGMKNA